ncbi:DUF2460 domain-containing protein [uncultured Jannaschia sp.]|uniref:DUF2460 domain-containing protein n=1 Tax=uncultured Jannaschia sp. TaxID=293347 RepID=UPI00260335E8|nr:DUF2460 domain-containing protein [uncultured Jannaschia sp.]
MAFHEVRFPTRLSYGSVGGPTRHTEIVTLANGFEERNTPWEHSRRRYNAGFGLRSLEDINEIVSFFEARRGQLYGFRWKDWLDYKSCDPNGKVSTRDQLIGKGNGKLMSFQIIKAYSSGEETYERRISKIVAGTICLAIDGVNLSASEYDTDIVNGVVSLRTAPEIGAKITAGYEFDVPARFDTDQILSSISSIQGGDIPDIPVVELRV